MAGTVAADDTVRLRHPGQTMDRYSGGPVAAIVKAWDGSEQNGAEGDCPKYGSTPLDATGTTESDPTFALGIPQASRTFTVVYCANNYVPRVDIDLRNRLKDVPVVPTPARLWPTNHDASETGEFDDDVANNAIFALNELAYLRKVNPERFDAVIKEYASEIGEKDPARAETFIDFARSAGAWGNPG